ncbi:MAG: MGH1-like glycoside hydrolase domain-containing protein [Oceanipulchritudo sp.]
MKIEQFPSLHSSHPHLNMAFRVAMSDMLSNLYPFKDGQLEEEKLCLTAGLSYPTLWTRDNSVNTWHAAGLFLPDVSYDSLRAVLMLDEERGGWRIGGQYWDAIIWAQGAWPYYLYQGNRVFLSESLGIIERSLDFFEDTEFDAQTGLFRGPAFFQDGISGYPDDCSETFHFGSDVRDWLKANPHQAVRTGFGIPWFALSTNCLYVGAYQVVQAMRAELGLEPSGSAAEKEANLKAAIQAHFWNEARGSFDYLLLPGGRRCEHQEGGGLAFALLFDVPTEAQKAALFENVFIAPAGIPCLWPTFPRYANHHQSDPLNFYGQCHGAQGFGRHSGTVWPQIQSLWARAALYEGQTAHFDKEFFQLMKVAVRDGQFTEIFHPLTGKEYGGLQEHYQHSKIVEWGSVPKTTWGSTGFISLVHMGLLGMRYSVEGIRFEPYLPEGIGDVSLRNITYRDANLAVTVTGEGRRIQSCQINGQSAEAFVPADASGNMDVFIELEE